MKSRLLLVFGAVAALLFGVTAPAQASNAHTNLRHSCTPVGAPSAGIQGVTCADIWTTLDYNPWAGSEALCQRVSDNVPVECSGAKQTIQLWNATKNKVVVTSEAAYCGIYTNYSFRCSSPDRNYVDFYPGGQIVGCDSAYVVVSTTIRLPGSGVYRTASVRTTNYRNAGCFP